MSWENVFIYVYIFLDKGSRVAVLSYGGRKLIHVFNNHQWIKKQHHQTRLPRSMPNANQRQSKSWH